jgi:glyoxylase-like metal-dependent hydrolase (beta-lactamase superfamily II)
VKGPFEIVPGVYGLGSELVNWYLVEADDGLVAVDAGLQGYADTLDADLRSIGHAPEEITALVLTHADGDHVGIAPNLRELGATVYVHADAEERLAKDGGKTGDAATIKLLPYLVRPGFLGLIRHFASYRALSAATLENPTTYRDGEVLAVPGGPRVIATPGHSPGHCCLLFEDRGALFVGDAFCTLQVVTRKTGPQLMPAALNVDNERCLESLSAIDPVEAAVTLPGHGEPWRGTPAEATAFVRERGRT